jgi:hypothetical protein
MSDDLQLQDCVRHKQRANFVVLAMKLRRGSRGTVPFIHNLSFKPDRLFRGGGGTLSTFSRGLGGPNSLSEHYEIENKRRKNVILKRICATIFAV